MLTRRFVSRGGIVALAAIISSLGCRGGPEIAGDIDVPDGWARAEHADAFALSRPSYLVESKSQGIDTYVKRYESAMLDVLIDYGSASLIGRVDKDDIAQNPGCVIDRHRIGDRDAVLLRCAPVGGDPARMVGEYPGHRNGTILRLTVTVKDATAAADAAAIIDSVRFFEQRQSNSRQMRRY